MAGRIERFRKIQQEVNAEREAERGDRRDNIMATKCVWIFRVI